VNNLAISVNIHQLAHGNIASIMDDTEGTSEPEDSVETTREAPVPKQPQVVDGSECSYCGVLAFTPSEVLLNKAFRKLSISFGTQRVISAGHHGHRYTYRYQTDLLVLQAPVVVECDDPYHRKQRGRRELDKVRGFNLRDAGYLVFSFTEQQLGEDADACARQVLEQASLQPEDNPVFDIRQPQSGPASATWRGGMPGWECETCGKHFHAYRRGGVRPCRTCSRECQVIWQRETKASVANRSSNSAKMRELWNNPEWRAKQEEIIRKSRWPDIHG
jgi:very-short-patch-repair endonuclease